MSRHSSARNLRPVTPGAIEPNPLTDPQPSDAQADDQAEAAAVAPIVDDSADSAGQAETTTPDVSEEAGETVAAAELAAPEIIAAAPTKTEAEVDASTIDKPVLTDAGWVIPHKG